MKAPHYGSHLETLTALVTHMAMTDWSLRTPPNLAKALSIDEPEIRIVLDAFKGLFRKSPNLSPKTGNPMYALQLRHARQWLDDEADDEARSKPPLEAEYLVALLNFITDRANQEARRQYTLWTVFAALVASILAFSASLLSLVLTFAPTSN